MTLEFKRPAKNDDRAIGAAPLADAMTDKTEQKKSGKPAVKSGDITAALAEIRRDPTAVARHHLGLKRQPAAVGAPVPAPLADPEPTEDAPVFEPEHIDSAAASAPIQAAETSPVEPAQRVETAPADLVGTTAAVVDYFLPAPIIPAEQPPADAETVEPLPPQQADSVEAAPIVSVAEPPAPSPEPQISAERHDVVAETPPREPPGKPASESMTADHDAQGFSSRVQRVLSRLRGQQRGQAKREPTMPAPTPPEAEPDPGPTINGAADEQPSSEASEPPEIIVETPEAPEIIVETPEAPEIIVEMPEAPEAPEVAEVPKAIVETLETPEAPEAIVEPPAEPTVEPDPDPVGEPAAEAGSSTNIIAYWEDLRFGRMLPAWADLDPRWIASCWPNSLLMRYLAESERLQLEPSFAETMRNYRDDDVEVERIDYTPMVTEWVIGVGRTAVELGQPTEDTEVFPSMGGQVGYRVVALPLSDDQTAVDHVLCHVSLA